MVEKDIVWAPGIHWHQHYVNLAKERFPVVWLEVNPRAAGVILRPMWSNPTTQVGTASLIQTAQYRSNTLIGGRVKGAAMG